MQFCLWIIFMSLWNLEFLHPSFFFSPLHFKLERIKGIISLYMCLAEYKHRINTLLIWNKGKLSARDYMQCLPRQNVGPLKRSVFTTFWILTFYFLKQEEIFEILNGFQHFLSSVDSLWRPHPRRKGSGSECVWWGTGLWGRVNLTCCLVVCTLESPAVVPRPGFRGEDTLDGQDRRHSPSRTAQSHRCWGLFTQLCNVVRRYPDLDVLFWPNS